MNWMLCAPSHFGTTMTLIGVLFMGLLTVYAWMYKVGKDTMKELAKIYDTVNKHMRDSSSHVPEGVVYVNSEVCAALCKAAEQSHKDLNDDIKEVKESIKSIDSDVKELLKR